MARCALVLVLIALGLSGCGSSSEPPAGAATAETPVAATGARTVETTDGRLGDATAERPGAPLDTLSSGGPLDLRRHGSDDRRDGVGAGAACANPTLAPAPPSLPAVAEATLCLLNGERADQGLPPLTPNATLASAATLYAQDLVAGSYFSHTGRDGSTIRTRLERAGYIGPDAGWSIGENLAWGTGALATAGSIVAAWMNSPGHRANVLNPDYREIGLGVVTGNPAAPDGAGATYATAFGVIETVDGDAAASQRPAESRPAARTQGRPARKAARRRAGKAKKARLARSGRVQGKGRGRATRRGPFARISI